MSMMQMIRLVKAIGRNGPHKTGFSGSYSSAPTLPIQYPISTSIRGKIAKVLASREIQAGGKFHA